jgi:hypothetical protein
MENGPFYAEVGEGNKKEQIKGIIFHGILQKTYKRLLLFYDIFRKSWQYFALCVIKER